MRLGLMLIPSRELDAVVEQVREARALGLDSVWLAQIFGQDAATALAIAGREVPEVTLGTAVLPVYQRHPIALAAQALTTQAACAGRFVLGIGLSHRMVIEAMYGLSFENPARYMQEYLGVLAPLLAGEAASFDGEVLHGNTPSPLQIEVPAPPPLLLAALAPRMLRIAGSAADGTITWMTGPATLADHVVPKITAAATAAGRPAPRVVVGLPVSVTADVEAARERAARSFAMYGQLPSYRAMIDREGLAEPGAAGPADLAIIGDEEAVTAGIGRVEDAGATEFFASAFGAPEDRKRTHELLKDLARS
jgi:5,10-methylenetetrahydromethanopterin reductase